MMDPKPLTRGDACPNCEGALHPARVPSAEQRRRAEDRENREPLPPHFDTMSDADRTQHGARFRCQTCGYETRFPLDAGGGAPPKATRSSGGPLPAAST
jgi:RNase P subunit RPR2